MCLYQWAQACPLVLGSVWRPGPRGQGRCAGPSSSLNTAEKCNGIPGLERRTIWSAQPEKDDPGLAFIQFFGGPIENLRRNMAVHQ
jgi:hypothetical protein